MTAIQFDSLKYARRLRDVGVPEPQADTQAELMAEAFGFYVDNLVTKEHLEVTKEHLDLALQKQGAQLDTRFAEQGAQIDVRFAEQDARIDARFAEQDARIDARFAEQDARIDARFARQERTLVVHTWMLGVITVTVLLPTLKGLAL